MATVQPPPNKRQKTAAADQARLKAAQDEIPSDIGSVRVQFRDSCTGENTGPVVTIPVKNATAKNLETLLNALQGNDSGDRLSYRFSYRHAQQGAAEPTDIDIFSNLYTPILKPGLKTTEDEITLYHTPQAVFRVNPVSRCSSSIAGHGEAILTASFSPTTSSLLATGSGDNTARIWDCDTGTPLRNLKGHTGWVLEVSFSPDGNILATGSMDNTVRIWSVKTGEPLGAPLKGHTNRITSLAWEPYHLQTPGRPRLASASKDATVRVWDVTSRRVETILSGHKGSITCLRWGGLGQIYTSSQDRTIKIWDPKKGTCAQTLSSHTHWVNHLALSTDFVIRTAFHDHTKSIPESAESKIAKAKSRFENAAKLDGKATERLVSASDDNTLFLWDPTMSNKPIARLLGHQKQVNHVTFSPNGSYIASAAWDNHVKLWNARDGKFITTLRGHVGPVYQCCFSADSRLLVSASKDTTLKVWEVRTGKLNVDLPGHQDEVYAVDWSPDGERVGSGGKDKAVKIWRH